MYYSFLGYPSFRIFGFFGKDRERSVWPDFSYSVNVNFSSLINRIDFVSYHTKEREL